MFIKRLLRELPYIKNLQVVPGHYYSPIINIEEIRRREKKIWSEPTKNIEGVDLRENEQLHLLERFIPYYKEIPFEASSNNRTRYYFDNGWYLFADGVFLYCMMREYNPKRIIEVGSGFSSALMLDTNDIFFGSRIDFTFIEPFPKRLNSLLKGDEKISLIQTPVQDVQFEIFDKLEENDILFIDSTHISKTGSDVNFIFFEIFPRLKKGVKIHLHDIHYPFEYLKTWVMDDRRSWNEAYMLKSFLMYNNKFKILAFNSFLEYFHNLWLSQNMPLALRSKGSSIWLEVN